MSAELKSLTDDEKMYMFAKFSQSTLQDLVTKKDLEIETLKTKDWCKENFNRIERRIDSINFSMRWGILIIIIFNQLPIGSLLKYLINFLPK